MISEEAIRDIVATYSEHGWVLRRVLLTPSSIDSLPPNVSFGDAPTHEATIDAAWFSRPPKPGSVAWELRYLGTPPFALVEKADETSEDFEHVLAEIQQRLADAIAARKAA